MDGKEALFDEVQNEKTIIWRITLDVKQIHVKRKFTVMLPD